MVSSKKTKRNFNSFRDKNTKKGGGKPNYNLVYMAKPPYGGWVSFTAHLSNKYNYPLFKVGNTTEKKTRPYGYDVQYQNMQIGDLINKPNLLITAIDKYYYQYLPQIKKATIVIHDPTELKEPVLEFIKNKNITVFTIREIVSKLLKGKYGINNKFLYHPLFEFERGQIIKKNKKKSLALSRIDFDKHTDIIIDANDKLSSDNQVDIYGAQNDLYVYHKLRDTNYTKYYKGKFPKEFSSLVELLRPCKFLVDMSAIKGDGGGSQYTFLEAIYMDCALILNSKWVNNVKTPFKHGYNCFIVENSDELSALLKRNPKTDDIIKNAKKLLKPHILGRGW